jgi:hypothetical protein
MADTIWNHQVKIAKATMKMNDVGVMVMGGMTKEEAKEILRKDAAKKKTKGKFGGSVLKHVTTKTKRVKDQVVRVTKGLKDAGVDMWDTLKTEPVDLGYYSKKKGRK